MGGFMPIDNWERERKRIQRRAAQQRRLVETGGTTASLVNPEAYNSVVHDPNVASTSQTTNLGLKEGKSAAPGDKPRKVAQAKP
jgi:hypothetical protein